MFEAHVTFPTNFCSVKDFQTMWRKDMTPQIWKMRGIADQWMVSVQSTDFESLDISAISKGIKVAPIRTKIECNLGQEIPTGYVIRYYESHMNLYLFVTDKPDWDENIFKASKNILSSNLHKICLTRRFHDPNVIIYDTSKLFEAKVKVQTLDTPVYECCIFDDNPTLDDGWIDD